MMRKLTLFLALALSLATAGADAEQLFRGLQGNPAAIGGGGGGEPGGGLTQMCDPGSSVCAGFQNGQTFVTWDDLATGATGNNWRYKVYRSTSPITSANYNSAELRGTYILNNSAHLIGGDPNDTGAEGFKETYRANGNHPRVTLSDLGPQLPAFSGLFAHTVDAPGSGYYAVVAFPTSGGSDTYIGSVGPIAESVGDQRPYKQYDSSRSSTGRITSPAGKPLNIITHGSSSTQGCVTQYCQYGDWWAWFLPGWAHWQEGLQRTLTVGQFTSKSFPSGMLTVRPRDTVNNSIGTGGLEGFHSGLGYTPLPYVGPPNRRYLGTVKSYERMFSWVIDHYGADPNQVHWSGTSMGAMAGASSGFRMTSPRISALWINFPVWQMYLRQAGSWPGAVWQPSHPFAASLAPSSTSASTLGTDPNAVLLPDGTRWGGAGGYADMLAYIDNNPGQDFPVVNYMANKSDVSILVSPLSFQQQLWALEKFQQYHMGHSLLWNMGSHQFSGVIDGLANCDGGDPDMDICVPKSKYRLDLAYLAFSNSSIDDDPGDGSLDVFGFHNGDPAGGINIGFRWDIVSDTSGGFQATVSNNWMSRAPTPIPTTTITAPIAATGGAGSVTVADGSVFTVTGGNIYFPVGGKEILTVSSVVGNTVNYSARGGLETSPVAHSAGETIQQYRGRPTGPSGGPYTTMTVDITPRRVQNFKRANGATVNCTITPFGESPVTQTPTVANSLWTLTAVKINEPGSTDIACN